MARARALYFTFLGTAVSSFTLAGGISGEWGDFGSIPQLARFALFIVGFGAAAFTWGTAVMIASVHKKVWALVVTVSTVAVGLSLAAIRWRVG